MSSIIEKLLIFKLVSHRFSNPEVIMFNRAKFHEGIKICTIITTFPLTKSECPLPTFEKKIEDVFIMKQRYSNRKVYTGCWCYGCYK